MRVGEASARLGKVCTTEDLATLTVASLPCTQEDSDHVRTGKLIAPFSQDSVSSSLRAQPAFPK